MRLNIIAHRIRIVEYTIDCSTSLSAERFFPVSRVTCIQLTFDKIDDVAALPCCCDGCAMVDFDVSEANDGADYIFCSYIIWFNSK